MADAFFALSPADRRDALEVAAARSGRAVHLLEKEVWVVWTLNERFTSDFADHLVFKGGTSLSKAYQAIGRFSEDVDLTYDIRAIAPDLARDRDHAIPLTRSQEQRWTKTIRERLDVWVGETVAPLLTRRLAESGLFGRAKPEGDTVLLTYEALTSGSGYVRPVVLLEFGARSTGEPSEMRTIRCDAATHLPDVPFPEASPSVMRPERTFWEKATAIHVFCRGGRFRGAERFSRHWYDVAKAIARLGSQPDIAEIVTTDTVPVPPEKRLGNMKILSVAPLLAEAIRRIHIGESVSVLFDV
jgi:hypothetical protein